MKKLNIIGCGKVGIALAGLWREHKCFAIGDVLNLSEKSAEAAVQVIGEGRAIATQMQMRPAELFLLGTPDDVLIEACELLSTSNILRAGDVVFHCSGSLASREFESAVNAGAQVASVHPIRSFTTIDTTPNAFVDTFCGVEGSDQALLVLRPAFEAIGATLLDIDPRFKMVYHAAAVMACNNLTALMELSMQAYQQAGIGRKQAMQLMRPIVESTIGNIFDVGPVKALSGPIARGDHVLLETQLTELETWNAQFAETYRSLGKVALSLSRDQAVASSASLKVMGKLLQSD